MSSYNWPPKSSGGGGSGTVTQVNTGPGLTGGPITTSGTVSLDGRSGNQSVGLNATSAAIVFSSTMTTTNYAVVPSVRNLIDANPNDMSLRITAKSATGFTVSWTAPTDTTNYVIEYIALRNV